MKTNYLNNKDILKEIHRSKTTYCSFLEPEYADYDIIVHDLKQINKKNIKQARTNRAERLAKLAHEKALSTSTEKRKLEEFEVKVRNIADTDVIFRVMTWEHVPTEELKPKVIDPDELADTSTEYDEKETVAKYIKCNFPPFQHYKVTEDGTPYCVGKSHWKGDLVNGHWSKDHGTMTPKLALMFMKLCERYATRSNWRGYCVDQDTEALTQDGWKNIDTISETDMILSINNEELTWSSIKSIFRSEFDGPMHYITSRGMDAFITPGHKLLTKRGLIPVEFVLESDRVCLMGEATAGPAEAVYQDELVELAGWIVTEGCYDMSDDLMRKIDIYQNPGPKADRIRNCLLKLGYKFSESVRNSKSITFEINCESSQSIAKLLPNKNLTMDFILALTKSQRQLLINTMIDGDGRNRGQNRSWTQKDQSRINMFLALCTISGIKTNTHYVTNHLSFGKLTDYYVVNLFSPRGNSTNVACLDFHGGKRNGRNHVGRGKLHHPNQPTTYYKGRVWCPETEYGSFVAKRNGKIYLTGNTYNDEMRSQALLQLSQIGLQFDESKSANPFAYYTAAITNSFTRVLNIEKRNQNLRDDILEMNNMTPSYTRQGLMTGGYYDEGE